MTEVLKENNIKHDYSVSYTDIWAICLESQEDFTYASSVVRQRPPLWSSGQSSWLLQIRRPGFDNPALPKKIVVFLERGPLSLASTTEELLDRKVAAPV
jgi:hypothetical protein